ncbi:hypothetical protein SDRG_15816 [Saprolegnia diclina VS20]|uniref:3'-5' exonuclease domain-containing protein n=1 Tax=Saprolegnia diclina (strain VS20) TaxID=1156394 RepID=T0R2S7_SAPDV|nr:hypothetical protein SDRG_15816 [Saprolegnia diclina VS20]EQC26328.1 hypothetical protein SDRG_15816 [Saprolegnia diclina VS20]|eukprot:XP_008620221.1 hypothetical protein SDRG_15816 [Saprolegnia diclina VS20]
MAGFVDGAWLATAVAHHRQRMTSLFARSSQLQYPVAIIRTWLLDAGVRSDVDVLVDTIAHALATVKHVALLGRGPDAVLAHAPETAWRAQKTSPRTIAALVNEYERHFKDSILSIIGAGHRFYVANMDNQVEAFLPVGVVGTDVVRAVVAALRADDRLQYVDGKSPYFTSAPAIDTASLELHIARASDTVRAALQLYDGVFSVAKVRRLLVDVPAPVVDRVLNAVLSDVTADEGIVLLGTGHRAQLKRRTRHASSPSRTCQQMSQRICQATDVDQVFSNNSAFLTQRMLDARDVYDKDDVRQRLQGPLASDAIRQLAHPDVKYRDRRFLQTKSLVQQHADAFLEPILAWVRDGQSFFVSYVTDQVRTLLPLGGNVEAATATVVAALTADHRLRYATDELGRGYFVQRRLSPHGSAASLVVTDELVQAHLPAFMERMLKTLSRVPRFFVLHIPGVGFYKQNALADAVVRRAKKDPRVEFHQPTSSKDWPYFSKAKRPAAPPDRNAVPSTPKSIAELDDTACEPDRLEVAEPEPEMDVPRTEPETLASKHRHVVRIQTINDWATTVITHPVLGAAVSETAVVAMGCRNDDQGRLHLELAVDDHVFDLDCSVIQPALLVPLLSSPRILKVVHDVHLMMPLWRLAAANDVVKVLDLQLLMEANTGTFDVPLGEMLKWLLPQTNHDRVVTRDDLDSIVERVGGFGSDNRAGLERQLHRISAIRNRQDSIIALTIRVGRYIEGNAGLIADLLAMEDKNILFLGEPGCGKTTIVREVSRQLATKYNVCIVDTSNEIAGILLFISCW